MHRFRMYFGGTFDYQAEYPAARTLKAPKPSWMQRYNMRFARRDVPKQPKAEAKARTAASLWIGTAGKRRVESHFVSLRPRISLRFVPSRFASPEEEEDNLDKAEPEVDKAEEDKAEEKEAEAEADAEGGRGRGRPTGGGLPAPSPDDSVEPAHFVAVWQGDAYAIWKENWGNTIRQWHGMPSPPSCSLDGIVHLYPDTAREIGLGAAHLLVRIKYNVLEIQGSKSWKPEPEEDHPAEDPTEDLDWQSCNGD